MLGLLLMYIINAFLHFSRSDQTRAWDNSQPAFKRKRNTKAKSLKELTHSALRGDFLNYGGHSADSLCQHLLVAPAITLGLSFCEFSFNSTGEFKCRIQREIQPFYGKQLRKNVDIIIGIKL